jgi:hypothetical protein
MSEPLLPAWVQGRLLGRHVPVTESGCWLWLGGRDTHGYGAMKINGVRTGAHRASYWVHKGYPGAMHVCHKCDTRLCINPDHLFLGSCADNAADMRAKGRSRVGERNHSCKLSLNDVMSIRASSESNAAIAQRFGISKSQAYKIQKNQSWRHLCSAPSSAIDLPANAGGGANRG